MPRSRRRIILESTDTDRIPDDFIEPTVLLEHLRQTGKLSVIGDRIRIRRKGGFVGLDIVIILFVYFASGIHKGMRTVWEQGLKKVKVQIAAVADRRKLASPPATSRALSNVELSLIRGHTDWLLAECAEVDDVMLHPASATRDAVHAPWHVFDLDPKVLSLRHRALPEAEDLPEPVRLSERGAAPGFAGRKRGHMTLRRTTVMHAGAGVWLHAHLSPGNGDPREDLRLGLDAIVATRARLGADARALARMDGEFGNVPTIAACRAAGVPLLTRLNRPSLYEDPVLLARLATASWRPVLDSLSGPRRLAADLGEFELDAGETTRRVDGTRFDPVTVRLVASLYKSSGKGKGGRVIDGWRVELFVADLPVDAWPAEDCVSTYMARSSEENRFAQEDRELGLDRIVSYDLPGQELANVVGLFVWNLRVALGFQAERPPADVPAPRLRPAAAEVECPPSYWPTDPRIARTLGKQDWDTLLASRPGWRWSESGELLCPEGRPLYVTSVRSGSDDATVRGVIFRRLLGGCEDCAHRAGCYTTVRPRGSKHIELQLPTEDADLIANRLAAVREARKDRCVPQPERRPVAAAGPRFLPSEARKVHSDRFNQATLHVYAQIPPDPPPRPTLVAVDDRQIQRRRKTWEERLAWNALPDGADIRLRVQGSGALRTFVGQWPSAEAGRKARGA